MTQEVEPLTWQKRTNLEEHQQFFGKINEIIANLAPTVEEAEQAIAQATAAVTSANAAVATANAASAAADAAAQQAQTAANTVAGYGTRLTAAEGGIDALQTADGQNVKINRINEYAVGLTGNQDYNGVKRALQKIVKKINFNGAELPTNYWIDSRLIEVTGNDGVPIISIGGERDNKAWSTRFDLTIWGESNPKTNITSNARIMFIFDEANRNIRMQVGYTDNAGSGAAYSQPQTLFTW